jgi:hypothetical protein
VFIGARPKELDRSIAIDYTRRGIELERRSDVEIAGNFNAEISRAVRYASKGREAAEALIAMYKRHATVVRRVLEEQLRTNAPKLIDRTLEGTSLLALALGKTTSPVENPWPGLPQIKALFRRANLGMTTASFWRSWTRYSRDSSVALTSARTVAI